MLAREQSDRPIAISNFSERRWFPPVIKTFLALLQERPLLRYAEIARRLNEEHGTHFTKNACIGFGRRIGAAPRQPARARPTGIGLGKKRRPYGAKQRLKPIAKPGRRRVIDRMLLEQLERNDCRWPEGTRSPYLFCGAPAIAGSPYCLRHSWISYPALRGQHAKPTVRRPEALMRPAELNPTRAQRNATR